MTAVSGKVALITGGAGAIGSAIAASMIAAGARVVIADRDGAALSRAAAALAERGAAVHQIMLDVRYPEQWVRAIADIERQIGVVQILFNNAGVSALGVPVEALPLDYWERVLAINLTSVVLGVQAVIPRLRERGLEGHVINTASVAGLGIGMPGAGAYIATKSAVVALSEVLELELREARIGVSVLAPGPVRSELWRTSRGALQLPEVDLPPAASRTGSASPDAMDPTIVGQMVVDAVEANRFLVVTHPDFKVQIAARHERFLADMEQHQPRLVE